MSPYIGSGTRTLIVGSWAFIQPIATNSAKQCYEHAMAAGCLWPMSSTFLTVDERIRRRSGGLPLVARNHDGFVKQPVNAGLHLGLDLRG